MVEQKLEPGQEVLLAMQPGDVLIYEFNLNSEGFGRTKTVWLRLDRERSVVLIDGTGTRAKGSDRHAKPILGDKGAYVGCEEGSHWEVWTGRKATQLRMMIDLSLGAALTLIKHPAAPPQLHMEGIHHAT